MRASSALTSPAVTQLPIISQADVVNARRRGRSMAAAAQFKATEIVLVGAAISELARNILLYARTGRIALQIVESGHRRGIRIVASDHGPGISDQQRAMLAGQRSAFGFGIGLRSVKRVMDEFEIDSNRSTGTRVTVTKWRA